MMRDEELDGKYKASFNNLANLGKPYNDHSRHKRVQFHAIIESLERAKHDGLENVKKTILTLVHHICAKLMKKICSWLKFVRPGRSFSVCWPFSFLTHNL
jgi:hypothetical protein